MSLPDLSSIAGRLRAAAVHAAWAQWTGIEAWSSGKPARSVVDPEALVLASLWLESAEPRLWRLLRSWAGGGARYLSVQRIKNLESHYPRTTRERLGDFAWECLHRGKDARWKGLIRQPRKSVREGQRDLEPSPRVHTPAALLLRLRIGLGVGIKADVLAYLLGSAGASQTLSEMTVATGYIRRAVDRAVDELVTAGLVTSLATAPASFRAPYDRWEALLELGNQPPVWWYWDQIYRFAGALEEAARISAGKSLFEQASRARDVVEQHYPAFDLNAVEVHEVTSAPGEDYLRVLGEDVARLAERMERNMV